MPKISAPTVAEHRVAQHSALVQAAREVLAESGITGISPRSVSERVGMARSSFYDYFPSKDDLLVAVAIDEFDRWNREIDATLAAVGPGSARLKALVEATMRMTAEGKHDLAGPLRQAALAPTRFEDLMALHDAMLSPLSRVVTELGVPHPDRFAALALGLLGAGIQLIQHGADSRAVADDVHRILTAGLPI